MKSITIELPDSIELTDFDAKIIIAGRLYQQAKLSSGQAAELVGISKLSFIELMGKYGYSYFGEATEVRQDIANA